MPPNTRLQATRPLRSFAGAQAKRLNRHVSPPKSRQWVRIPSYPSCPQSGVTVEDVRCEAINGGVSGN